MKLGIVIKKITLGVNEIDFYIFTTVVFSGLWGNWSSMDSCPQGKGANFINGFRTRVEPSKYLLVWPSVKYLHPIH